MCQNTFARAGIVFLGVSNREVELRYPSAMDVLRMLDDLRQERARLAQTILAIERLVLGGSKRRGRRAAWMKKKNAH
jgi:hypothetical protein